LSHVRAQVAFGPRPAGSEALQKCRDYIIQQLKGFGYTVDEDAFDAQTPYGTKHMVNLIAHMRVGAKGIIALASHYDTATKNGFKFVGANDGGSSTGLLLELARVLAGSKDELDYWFLFLDGEEAFVEWSNFDSTYGSRHLARRWKQDGTAARVRSLILLDMIGDKNLDILKDRYSTRWLSDLVWETAANAGLQSLLSSQETYIEDDHIAFLDAGIPCIDLIDLNYGPNNSYWHTEADTLDKISAESMEKTGKLVLTSLPALQKKLSTR
jgi:Zn-dependent M28 family amino/carboxypeptidase